MDQRFVIFAAAAVIAYLAFRLVSVAGSKPISHYEREIEDILSSEKYKVKGRFED